MYWYLFAMGLVSCGLSSVFRVRVTECFVVVYDIVILGFLISSIHGLGTKVVGHSLNFVPMYRYCCVVS